jgi:ubiquinone/menaquinone biosynthesis C-methylase UbiE
MGSINHAPLDKRPHWNQQKTPSGKRRMRNDDNQFPNDALEAGRLEMQHGLLKLALRRIFFAPVSNPRHILDIGCGTGQWALETLQQFPCARMTALDIDPVLFKHFLKKHPHSYSRELDRLHFLLADATKPLPFADGTFDFAHTGIPDTFLSEEDWPHLIREMARVTRTEGWVEILASGQLFTEQTSEVCNTLREAEVRLCQAINIAPTGGPGLLRYLTEAGITNYQLKNHVVGKTERQRKLIVRDLKYIIEATRPLIMKFGILPPAIFDSYLAQFEQEALRAGLLFPWHSVWFQPKGQLGEKAL